MNGIEAAKKKCRTGLLIWREENQETSFTEMMPDQLFEGQTDIHQGIKE